jgi:hypothetical protein
VADVQAGVVDEDIDLAVLVDGSADHIGDVSLIEHVELDGQGPAAHALDLLLELRQSGLVPAGDNQVRPGLSQCPAEILPPAGPHTPLSRQNSLPSGTPHFSMGVPS